MKSSEKSGNGILGAISRKRAERLLLDWANLPNLAYKGTNEGPIQRMLMHYPDVFEGFSANGIKARGELIGTLIVVRDDLRKAWDAPDSRHREWYLFKLRDFFKDTLFREQFKELLSADPESDLFARAADRFNEPPPITPLEAAMFHFQRIADTARHCPNPNCSNPYFFATKKGQKYCSGPCARPAQREAKRRWWAENRGKESTSE
jgi:hypothetical protein